MMKKNIGWPLFDKNEKKLVNLAIQKSIHCASEGKNVGFTKKFEIDFAKYHKKKYGVACFNCTVGLEALLICADIGPGDEILVPAFTYTSSVTSILRVGAIPIFIDINKRTLCADLDSLKKNISKKTKAIMLVHFGGYLNDLKKIKKIAKNNKLRVVEDAAQAHGSKRDGLYPGEIDAGAIFSFQRNKNMCSGEGGILLTNNKKIANKFRQFIWHGTLPGKSNIHNFTGTNFRITEFQSAILIAQLKKLKRWNNLRMMECKKLDKFLSNYKMITLNHQNELEVHARHLYSFRVENKRLRKKIINNLNKNSIICGPGYSYPVYKSPLFKNKKFPKYFLKSNIENFKRWYSNIKKLNLENSEKVCKENIIIPHFNFLEKNSSKKIFKLIQQTFNEKV